MNVLGSARYLVAWYDAPPTANNFFFDAVLKSDYTARRSM